MRLHAPFHFITPADRRIQQQKKETSFTGMFPFFVGLLGFEPRKTGPESVVLPLHHSPNIRAAPSAGLPPYQ